MKKIMNWLIFSCKKATGLLEKQSIFRLSIQERIRLKMHLFLCGKCAEFCKQNLLIDKYLSRQLSGECFEKIPLLNNEALKERILNQLPKE